MTAFSQAEYGVRLVAVAGVDAESSWFVESLMVFEVYDKDDGDAILKV